MRAGKPRLRQILVSMSAAILLLTACQPTEDAAPTTSTPPAGTSTSEAPATTTTTTPPTTTSTILDNGILVMLSPDPVVTPYGESRYVNPGWTINTGDIWLMFRNSFSAWPGPSDVSLMISEDGITWVEHGDGPVFSSDQVDWTDGNVFFMTGYIEDDGTVVAYFYTYDGVLNSGAIGRATAPGPDGPFTPDPEPVLTPGDADDWDGGRVVEPSVLVDNGGGLTMWYTGIGPGGNSRIGLATSTDGINWEKYDDPDTTGAAFDNSDPIFGGDQDWVPDGVNNAVVTPADGGYQMVFTSAERATFAAGAATSADGIDWVSSDENPIVTQEVTPSHSQFWQYDLQRVNDVNWFFLEIGSGSVNTDVYAYQLNLDEG